MTAKVTDSGMKKKQQMATEDVTTGEIEQEGGESVHRLEAQRRANRDSIAALGADPYGERAEGLVTVALARGMYDAGADEAWQKVVAEAKERAKQESPSPAAGAAPSPPGGEGDKAGETPAPLGEEGEDERPVVRVAGRVMLKRDTGKLVWLQIRDHTSASATDLDDAQTTTDGLAADLQVAISKRDCAAPGFDIAKVLDMGDIVIASGPLMKTRKGEVTIWASGLTMACKSLAPPPEKWKGLSDIETRYRKRYVDLHANPDVMRTFKLRAGLFERMRAFMNARGDIEVETPILQSLAGGAAARPFATHMNALDISLFMRIAPELYLKRLIVGGMPGVYEFSRNFRNEGMDRTHNPEFTMLEVYEAFGNYRTMLELTEGLVRDGAAYVWEQLKGVDATGPMVLAFGDHAINYSEAFDQVTYSELFERSLGFAIDDHQRARAEAKKRGLKHEGIDAVLVTSALFEDAAEPSIDPARPTFVLDYPAALCPLTRSKKGKPEIAERFELFMGGFEIANAYTELNDPDIQEAKFREQLEGVDDEESTFRNFDEDFIEALKVGMPPAGGLGVGIDRLCMLLLNQATIRDVLLFPMMKPVD